VDRKFSTPVKSLLAAYLLVHRIGTTLAFSTIGADVVDVVALAATFITAMAVTVRACASGSSNVDAVSPEADS
jgi:hypothetical protein